MTKSSLLMVTLAFTALAILPSCKEDDSELLRQSKQIASQFHTAVLEIKIDEMSELVNYPFHFDNETVIRDAISFKKEIKKKLRGMKSRMKSARSMEAVTYADFIAGHEIRGKKFEGDKAREQAKKLNFEEGDVLVRCYAVDKKKREDGREYFVVLRKNDLGDLKIHTYFD